MGKIKETICGVELKKIRTAFFKGKLEKLLLDIQASDDYTAEDFEKLKLYLTSLKKKDEQLSDSFSDFLPNIETDQPDSVLDELNKESLSEAETAELGKEEANRKAAVAVASKLLKRLFIKFHNPKEKAPSEDELMDMGFELLGLDYYLARDMLYKERLFRKKIVEFERMGKQRKMAEELAKITMEYRNYFLAEQLKNQCLEFINLAKKRYHTL